MIRVEDVNNSHQPWPHDRQLTVKEVSGSQENAQRSSFNFMFVETPM